jgi:hypothetical protein|tara:strand:+ start:356 stop:985 length:630 start_codon:yes stop_codon:yes gene_type:complete
MLNLEIIDNFLSKDDFDKLSKLTLDEIPHDSIKVYHNEITKNNIIKKSCIDSSLIQSLHKNYHKKAFDILMKTCPEKAELYEYSDFSVIKTGKHYKFPIHDDTPNKLLSGVIYLYPKNNTGTIFYGNKKGDKKKVVDWKQNRGVFFSRVEKETWHSFEGDGQSDRIALVYNLVTNQIKRVFEIENKNFFTGLLRYKINPYLNSLFKKTI